MRPTEMALCVVSFAALSACATGCTGELLGGGAPGQPGTGTGGAGTGTAGSSGSAGSAGAGGSAVEEGAGLIPLRRLGVAEYENTIHSLFGSQVTMPVELPDDPQGTSTYPTPTVVGSVERDGFERAADGIAKQLAPQLATLAPCAPGADERTCARQFLESFGKRAFRRPVRDTELAGLLGLYDAVRAAPISASYTEATQTLLSAMLQSPQFLYHWELGAAAPVVEGPLLRLDAYELASRVSYFLWATMPDAELLTAADSGALDTQAGLEAQVRRMLPAADTARLVTSMVGWWIRTDKLPALQKQPSIADVTPELKTALNTEFEAFTTDTLLTRGSYRDLLTSANGFVTGPTASIYGLSGSFGSAPVPAQLPNGRVGLFSQAAFLALEALPQESSPVHRGKMVATRLLCRTIAPPPPGVDTTPPTVPENVQTREAYAEHSTSPACAGCHVQMDPLGFGFEHFDAIGRYRDMEAGRPIDATGTILGLDGADVSFDGVASLMQVIAESQEGQRCFVQQMARYALNRALGEFDTVALDESFAAFKNAALDPRALIPALVTSKSFRYRVPAAGEVTQ